MTPYSLREKRARASKLDASNLPEVSALFFKVKKLSSASSGFSPVVYQGSIGPLEWFKSCEHFPKSCLCPQAKRQGMG